MSNYKTGDKFGDWCLKNPLSLKGGNGDVWKAKNINGKEGAIKLLKYIKPKIYTRFLDEINAIDKLKDIEGILPIIDSFIPPIEVEEMPWYVMPIAKPLFEELKNKKFLQIVKCFIKLGETLNSIHLKGYSHRDIKPSNLLYCNGIAHIADFGLVDFEQKEDISNQGEEIGPKWTIAPEMKRNPQQANGQLADVYSFAKTLWIFLTKDEKAFEGQYSLTSNISLRNFIPKIDGPISFDEDNNIEYTKSLELLLFKSTENNPNERPTMEEFVSELQDWVELHLNYFKRNPIEWKETLSQLFPFCIPERAIWTNVEEIYEILKILCSINSLNHMFYPDGGGDDLREVKLLNYDKQYIEINGDLISPKKLIFEKVSNSYQWQYFRIELNELDKISKHEYREGAEYLTEIENGVFQEIEIWDNREFNELPETARPIKRFLKGSFVIFQKMSQYNHLKGFYDAYDARHNKMNSEEFKAYIRDLEIQFGDFKYIERKHL